jgi:hypothetical protein
VQCKDAQLGAAVAGLSVEIAVLNALLSAQARHALSECKDCAVLWVLRVV